jgi:hypothetical protein
VSSSDAGAAAFNPGVLANGEPLTPVVPRTSQQQAYLDAIADEAEGAVEALEKKLAGMQESLAAAKERAEQARRDAQEESN